MLETQDFVIAAECAECFDANFLALLEGPAPETRRLSPPTDFELPPWMWGTMAACYGVFFTALAIATAHSGPAVFAILVSVGYALMYFGTARILANVRPGEGRSAFARGFAPLATWTGPMEGKAVAAQVLIVPLCLALFGVSFAAIAATLN